MADEGDRYGPSALRDWLKERIAEYVQLKPEHIRCDVPFSQYGMESVYAFVICDEIEQHAGIEIDPTAVWDHQTIDDLAGFLVDRVAAREADGQLPDLRRQTTVGNESA